MDLVSDTAAYCVQFMQKSNLRTYQKIIDNCRNIGTDALKRDYYVPPTSERMAYQQYDGTGKISISRTQAEFCTRGRRMDAVVGRRRIRRTPALNLAIIVNNSDQMTGWSRSGILKEVLPEEHAPLVFAKIAAIALLDGLAIAETKTLITFGSEIDFYESIDYKRLLRANGSGCGRLDLALAELLRVGWDLRSGERQLIILSSMPPETGTGILLEDIGIQEMSLIYMRRMIRDGVRILYLPIVTQMELVDTMIGAYTSRSFAQRIHSLGIAVSVIGRADMFVSALRGGVKQMLQSSA